MADPLLSFVGLSDPMGELKMEWKYPLSVTPGSSPSWKLFIFKKRDSAVDDATIADYLDGQIWGSYGLTNQELAEKHIMVFRTIQQLQKQLFDFDVLNNNNYYYRAVMAYQVLPGNTTELSAIVNLDPSPVQALVNLHVRVIDGKDLVVRAMERLIDSLKSSKTGSKPILERDIRVHRDFARDKDEDFWVTVQRLPGQNVERYLGSSQIATIGDSLLKGEVDLDVFSVEWLCIGKPLRRDKFTDIVRGFRPVIVHYIQKMGIGYVRDVRIIMAGDMEGQVPGQGGVDQYAVEGKMTVILTVQSQMEVGRLVTTGIQIDTTYEGDE